MKTQKDNYNLKWNAKIAMRDGIKISANIYMPANKKPVPVIVSITPYIADNLHSRGSYFAQNGYAYLAVDARGRGNSEGEFTGFENGHDGHDIVEWAAKQPWCNSKVAMRGASFLGGIQWRTLNEFPPHLNSIVPGAATFSGTVTPLMKNIFIMEEYQWWVGVAGNTPNDNLAEDDSFWIEKYKELYSKQLPYNQLDKLAGIPSEFFQTTLKHPTIDSYYENNLFSKDDYKKIDIPILTITGHYDDTQTAALKHYKMHMKYGLTESIANHYVLIGPWDHGGVSTPSRNVGGLEFGKNSVLDLNNLHKEWFDWTLKNGKKPEFLKKKITYYVAGLNEWKYADDFENISTEQTKFYLNSENAQANDVYNSGFLQSKMSDNSIPDEYIYDPLNVEKLLMGRDQEGDYLLDQTYVQNLNNDGLIYHSPVFEKDTEITGFIVASLWIELNVPDTDFQVTIFEMTPKGEQIRIAQDFLRARYRESNQEEKLIIAGEINEYVFDDFAFFSRLISKGSRLRVLISSPNTWFFERNYNGGGVVAQESGKDAQTAHIKLHHGINYPSWLELPIVSND